MTKEEMQAVIDFIMDNPELFDDKCYTEKHQIRNNLESRKTTAKSIQDLQEHAFDSAREGYAEENEYLYLDFEDYLNSLENA